MGGEGLLLSRGTPGAAAASGAGAVAKGGGRVGAVSATAAAPEGLGPRVSMREGGGDVGPGPAGAAPPPKGGGSDGALAPALRPLPPAPETPGAKKKKKARKAGGLAAALGTEAPEVPGSNVLSPWGAARTKKPKLQKTLSKQAQDEVWDVKAMVSRRHAPPTRLRGAQRRLVTDGRRGWDRFARTRVSSWS